MTERDIDPKYSQFHLDSCAFDPKEFPEDEAAIEIWDLYEKGIDDNIVAEGLQEAGQDWYKLAHEVRLKKFGAGPAADYKDKTRQMRFLQSRGFDTDHIKAAVSADSE